MPVKDIAKIHGRSIREINEVINRNIKRFKNEIDLIDLKQIVPNDLFSDYGFTKAQWGNAKNIHSNQRQPCSHSWQSNQIYN